MHIVLYQPQIPPNTGNIVRTCAVIGAKLTLVGPLGFDVSDKSLRRAGLDYWLGVDVTIVDSLEELLEKEDSFVFLSSKATKLYTEHQYSPEETLIFGSETSGLPKELEERFPERFLKLPMVSGQRCLNLSSAVAICSYEAWRQNSFA